jgi:glycerophosphoryl diester phosphodiesterase
VVRSLAQLLVPVCVVGASIAMPVGFAHAQDHRMPWPLVIAHRGASGHLPEHTLEGYALAAELGADFIECDLVATKDGHLIARHEPNIVNSTDVADRPEFAARRRTMEVDGRPEEGFFTSDFTLAEIRSLRARQTVAERPQGFNGRFGIPSFEDVVALAQRKSLELGRVIGVYPEIKHPGHHRQLGLRLEARMVDSLERVGWSRRDAPVIIQSFEPASLKALRGMTRARLVQLLGAQGDIASEAGLREVAGYADGIGPSKGVVLRAGPELIERAHRLRLQVHVYTFRNEARSLAPEHAGNPVHEYLQFFALGADGVFSDFPETAVAARALHRLQTDPAAAACLTSRSRADCDGTRR